jgi:S-adenosylmethionine-dependent methyltransferase
MVEDAWAPLADAFAGGHYATLRGQVRTHVVDRQLRWHLPPSPAQVIDVGGGGGQQSLPLARDGYRVTLVDPSPAMLDHARRLLGGQPGDVADRVTLVEARGEEAPAATSGAKFAAVLCHGVVMYLDDPSALLSALVELGGEGAVISVVAKNARCLAVRPALQGDWRGALAAFDSAHQVNGLGVDTRADTVEGLSQWFGRRRVETVAWYGVRLFTDGWTPERPATDPDELVLAVELEASRRDPYRQLSRLFHWVGRRQGGSPA